MLLLKRGLLCTNFKTSHLVSLIKWLAGARHNIACLKHDKFTFLKADVVGNKKFDSFHSANYVKFTALQEITNFFLCSFLQGSYF